MTDNISVDPDYNILSIQVSLDGFSFCVRNELTLTHLTEQYIPFTEGGSPEKALDEIKHIFDTLEWFKEPFKKVIVIYANELFTLVPKPLFQENNLTDYLKYNTKILKTDFIVYDEIGHYDLVNVYVPYANINNYFFDQFGSFTYYHSMSVFVKNVLDNADTGQEKKVVVSVSNGQFDLIAHEGKNLILANSFQYQNPEDFTYYILFCLEQLRLSPDQLKLELAGLIEETDPEYKMIYDYVRNTSIGNPPAINPVSRHSYLHLNLNL